MENKLVVKETVKNKRAGVLKFPISILKIKLYCI